MLDFYVLTVGVTISVGNNIKYTSFQDHVLQKVHLHKSLAVVRIIDSTQHRRKKFTPVVKVYQLEQPTLFGKYLHVAHIALIQDFATAEGHWWVF